MKQKQMILMVVAVGCGLVAALLTSQLGAKPAAAVPQVPVIVAAKELTPGTTFTKDSLKDQVKTRMLNPNDVPQNAISTPEELEGKQLVKTLRADDHLTQTDLGKYEEIRAPAGKKLVCLKLPIESLTPFVRPTSRVDLLGTIRTEANKVKSRVLIPNMLVLAVDTLTQPNPGPQQGSTTIQMVTLAADIPEAEVIRRSQIADLKLSFILNTGDTANEKTAPWNAEEVFQWIDGLNGSRGKEGGDSAEGAPKKEPETAKAPPAVKIWVPTEDLPAGTALTSDLFDKKFREVEWKEKVPDQVVLNVRDHVGQYLVKDVFKEFPVVKTAIGKKPDEQPKEAVPMDDKPKRATFDQTIQGPSGGRVYRYEQQDGGKLKLLGEVQPDGSVVPVQGGPPVAPAPAQPAAPREPRIT